MHMHHVLASPSLTWNAPYRPPMFYMSGCCMHFADACPVQQLRRAFLLYRAASTLTTSFPCRFTPGSGLSDPPLSQQMHGAFRLPGRMSAGPSTPLAPGQSPAIGGRPSGLRTLGEEEGQRSLLLDRTPRTEDLREQAASPSRETALWPPFMYPSGCRVAFIPLHPSICRFCQ